MNAGRGEPIRLLIVDYQQAIRRGLRMRLALEPDLEVVGEVGSVVEAIPLARSLRPDVILMDVETPDTGGVAATERLRAVSPQSALVIFTLRDDAATRERCLAAGAERFVAKHQTEDTLLAVIRVVAGERRRRNHA